MEEILDVKPVMVDFKCPKCGQGYLRFVGNMTLSNPPQFPHMCNNKECNYLQTFNHQYPFIDYRKI